MKKRYEKSSNNTFKLVILPRSVDDNYTKGDIFLCQFKRANSSGILGGHDKSFKMTSPEGVIRYIS